MSGHVVAVASNKGGVGKTSTVLMLAESLAVQGESVALVDLDPQASLSLSMVGDAVLAGIYRERKTVETVLEGLLPGKEPRDVLAHLRIGASPTTHDNRPLPIALLAAGPRLRDVEDAVLAELAGGGGGVAAVRERLGAFVRDDLVAPLAATYDWVILDCPPYLPLLSSEAVLASALCVVPFSTDYLSMVGVRSFIDRLYPRGSTAPLPWALATRHADGENKARNALASMREAASAEGARFAMFGPVIPRSTLLSVERPPATTVAYRAKYDAKLREGAILPLVKELRDVLGNR